MLPILTGLVVVIALAFVASGDKKNDKDTKRMIKKKNLEIPKPKERK